MKISAMKICGAFLIALVIIIIVLAWVPQRRPQSDHDGENTIDVSVPKQSERTSAFDQVSGAVESALDGYDVIATTTSEGDTVNIHISVRGGKTIDKYVFGFTVYKSKEAILSVLSDEELRKIGNIYIRGTSESRTISWTTADMKNGLFIDMQLDSNNISKSDESMKYDDVLNYCGYNAE